MFIGTLLLSLAVLKSIFKVETYQLNENNHKRMREVVVVVVVAIIAVLLAATVVEKNKSFPLRYELKSFFIQILPKRFLSFYFGTDMATPSRGRKSRIPVNSQKSEAHRFRLCCLKGSINRNCH